MNDHYRTVATVRAAHGYSTGEHEFQITPQGTALIDAHTAVPANLSRSGGSSHGSVADSLIQEINIRTGRLVWEWDAYRHVPLSASYVKPSGSAPYDYFHLNSIQQLPDHNFLISARNTSAVYEISRRTGRVIWTLGGKRSSFRLGRGVHFEWQHDAHLSGHVLTLFDDADGGGHHESQSSGKALRIDLRARRVTLLRRYTHTPPLLTSIEGSVQTLPNRNVFVGWGSEPDFSEYSPSGEQLFNGSFRLGVSSYRAYRFVWHAWPLTRPDLAVATGKADTLRLWMSWDGATQVASWEVVGGSSRRRLRPLGSVAWSGFETRLTLSSQPRYVAVRALNSGGHVLRRSRIQAVQSATSHVGAHR